MLSDDFALIPTSNLFYNLLMTYNLSYIQEKTLVFKVYFFELSYSDNRERYEDITAVRQVKEERDLMQLKAKDEIEIMNLKAEEDLKRTECKERKELEIMELKRLKQQEILELQMRGELQLKREQTNLLEAETKKEAKILEINSKSKISKQHCQSLIEEKKSLLDELPKLEKDCIRLNKTATEVESYKGYFGYGYS